MKFRSNPTTQPPLGGLISNYILLKDHPDYINQFPLARHMPDSNILPAKRQIYDSIDEGVVITAENPQNLKKSEGNKQEQNEQAANNDEDKEEENPAVAHVTTKKN